MSTRFAATIDNSDIAAKRAQCDYAGNNIEQTYAKKSDIKNGELLVRYGDGQYSGLFEANTDATCYLDLNYRTYIKNGSTTTFFPGFPTLDDMHAIYTQPDWNASEGVAAIKNKPTIPTVNNGTLYFGLGTDTPAPKFTANQSGDSTIVVPYRTFEQSGSTTTFSKGLCTMADMEAIYTQPDWNASSGVAAIKNKPTIPTVNNGTLTIKQGTSTLGTFTANQSGNTTVTISDPANLPKRYFLHDAANIDQHQTFKDFQYEYTLPNDFDASVGYVMNATFQIQRPTNKSWSIGDTAVPIYFAIHTQNGTSVAFQSSTMFSNINGSYANYLACISTTHEFSPTTFQTYRKLYFDITIPSAYRSTIDQLYLIADMYFVEAP